MEVKTVKRMDVPEKQNIIALMIYTIFSFAFFPFFLTLFRIALDYTFYGVSWLELLFHGLNFAVTVGLFREFLQYSWWILGTKRKSVITMTAVCVAVMLSVALTIYRLIPEQFIWIASENVLPLVEAELYMTPSYIVIVNPILGTIALTVFCPVVTCCLYYGVGFTAAYNIRPWLGYLAVAGLAALLALANGLTWRNPLDQFVTFLCQLPMHLICCWAYHKTDSLWTPIFAQVITNLLVCLLTIFVL